ncbi:MAG: hypothetical protein H6672_05700 [Anaerolineaceae bacterium]|nr:hypothetical protein [Anaerolineaceae bacterium]
MMKPFVIHFSPGPGWSAGKTSREQPYWDEHAVFMDGLFSQGRIILGGPYADYSGVLVIITAEDEETARMTFAEDPFTVNGVLTLTSVHEWLIFLDSRQKTE